jgi:hypothetical protein
VFLVNSRLGLFTATPASTRSHGPAPARAPLLPKLRGHVAEFLGEGSPVHLSRLLPAHQRRFAVRAWPPLARGFSWRHGGRVLQVRVTPHPPAGPQVSPQRLFLPGHPTPRHARCPFRVATLPLRVPPSLITQRPQCRSINLLSIDYASRPRLRSDYPWVDHPAPGTLGLAVAAILTLL